MLWVAWYNYIATWIHRCSHNTLTTDSLHTLYTHYNVHTQYILYTLTTHATHSTHSLHTLHTTHSLYTLHSLHTLHTHYILYTLYTLTIHSTLTTHSRHSTHSLHRYNIRPLAIHSLHTLQTHYKHVVYPGLSLKKTLSTPFVPQIGKDGIRESRQKQLSFQEVSYCRRTKRLRKLGYSMGPGAVTTTQTANSLDLKMPIQSLAMQGSATFQQMLMTSPTFTSFLSTFMKLCFEWVLFTNDWLKVSPCRFIT